MKYEPFTFRFFRYLWRFKLTRVSRQLFYVLGVSAVGSVWIQIPVYQMFFSLAALLGVVWLVGLTVRPNVSITGRLPERVTAGQIVTAELTVTNRARRSAYELMGSFPGLTKFVQHLEQDRSVPCLKPGESVRLPIKLEPLKRGLYELPHFSVHTTFPFNLLRSGSSRHRLEPLLVLPAFDHLTDIDVPTGVRYQPGGISLTSNIGESPEYIGSREYVPGDSARRLDFRSWARLGKPVVREYQEEYYCRIALVLDTFVAEKRKQPVAGFAELEAAVSLAASAADALCNGEFIIDLFAAGPELYVFRAGRHTAHFDNVLEILACVEACRRDPFEVVTPALADELGNISSTICVFLDWDEPRRQLARAVMEAGSSLKVIIVRDSETSQPLHDAELGDLTRFTSEQIRAGGLEVL